jgi:alpha-tubulin suppressor-like RCC1 family protein
LDEFESFYYPKEVLFFKEKIISYLDAGSYHSLALSIEGYPYIWGRNDRGQLGFGDSSSIKSDSKMPCPKLIDTVLGIGVAQASCNYNQTFLGCADKIKNKPDTSVFNVWKNKLKKHEEREQGVASQHYRHQKRALAK